MFLPFSKGSYRVWTKYPKGTAMRRNLSIAVIFSLMLSTSGCATYTGADGSTAFADPPICESGICTLLIVGAIAAGAVALAHH
jgi:hypothetical protein